MRTVAFMIRRTSGTLAAGSDSIQNTILKAHPHKIMQITSIIIMQYSNFTISKACKNWR
jgi:hypothetical protein